MLITGWFKGATGETRIEYADIPDAEALSFRLYLDFGPEWAGVDMELEGKYTDGTDISTTMTEMLEDLAFLCA